MEMTVVNSISLTLSKTNCSVWGPSTVNWLPWLAENCRLVLLLQSCNDGIGGPADAQIVTTAPVSGSVREKNWSAGLLSKVRSYERLPATVFVELMGGP